MRSFVNALFCSAALFTAFVAVSAPRPAEAELNAIATSFADGVGVAGSGYLDRLYLSQESNVERGFMVASAD
ncbi:hypothetical protein [Roseobacter sp. HKCCA0434]|uniref:hypothetical protein n=1 Tax=Roseobacter sp. HKCCA0434 TaxID=3079297 RepID=UPI002905D598|nr:hypothetical protein [Roseobacter sp. HKCCA0434]